MEELEAGKTYWLQQKGVNKALMKIHHIDYYEKDVKFEYQILWPRHLQSNYNLTAKIPKEDLYEGEDGTLAIEVDDPELIESFYENTD